MMLKRVLLVILSIVTLLSAGVFDDRYPSARASGMSNAFVAVANDAWAPWYNPAGLAQIETYQAGLAYQKPFNYSFFSSVFGSAVIPLQQFDPSYGAASLSVENFGVRYKGEDVSKEYVAALSHGFYLLNDIHTSLSIGYSLKYYYWDLGESVGGTDLGASGAFGVDVGMQASIYKRTYIGMYLYNLNAPTIGVESERELPRRIVIGAAYKPYTGLTTSLSMNKALGFDTQYEAGFEFQLIEMLALRLGASTQPSRFSAGAGINYQGFRLDYSFRNHPTLSETHSFSITYEM